MHAGMRRLYDLGFALHFIRPRSKVPVESGWTTGPRKNWNQLEEKFDKNFNLGVRLGTPSRLPDGTYLAVVDCDVKSALPEHMAEMKHKLAELGIKDAPTVFSGRGNGSMHFYVRTQTPLTPARVGQASVKVKVLMPDTPVSKWEREKLGERDLRAGLRLRAAWEISLMGEGQQVVLPPSVHPDTGKLYRWKDAPEHFESFPLFKWENESPKKSEESVKDFTFTPEDVDLDLSDLTPGMVALIADGEGCSDRSAGLLIAAVAMLKAHMSENEVLSVLTDKNLFLGSAAFEHAKTNDRTRAARWLSRYTLPKARLDSPAQAFDDDLSDGPRLPEKEAKAQEVEVLREDWRHRLERCGDDSGRPKSTLANLILILRNEVNEAVFKRDDFAGSEVYGIRPPWGGDDGAEIRDIDVTRMKTWFAAKFRIEPPTDKLNEAVAAVGDLNRFHPVRDYLNSLDWDGVPRIDSWIKRHMNGRAPEPYLSEISAKTLVALVSRVFEPGCKYDHVLILEGKQGYGKSTALRILTSPWFSDATIDVRDKDAVLALKSVWCLELGELSGMRHAEVNAMKEFITRQTDRIRLPYGKRTENFPRQCVFVGTTNDDEYLKDTTGNRRFWPVTVGKVNFDGLREERHQLWAEAVESYRLGEALYLERGEVAEQAKEEQSARQMHDVWVDRIASALSKPWDGFDPKAFTVGELFGPAGPLAEWKENRSEQMRAADALRVLGCARNRARVNGAQVRVWTIPDRLAQVGTTQDDDI